jgi:DNA-binding transcriptional ArsR family regulator
MDIALKAIAEPRRREILQLLGDRELTAGEIAGHFTITRPAVSQHLATLKAAELVRERRQGTRRFYRARPEGLVELRDYLDTFWGAGLERLRAVVESDEAGRRTTKPPRRASR